MFKLKEKTIKQNNKSNTVDDMLCFYGMNWSLISSRYSCCWTNQFNSIKSQNTHV